MRKTPSQNFMEPFHMEMIGRIFSKPSPFKTNTNQYFLHQRMGWPFFISFLWPKRGAQPGMVFDYRISFRITHRGFVHSPFLENEAPFRMAPTWEKGDMICMYTHRHVYIHIYIYTLHTEWASILIFWRPMCYPTWTIPRSCDEVTLHNSSPEPEKNIHKHPRMSRHEPEIPWLTG